MGVLVIGLGLWMLWAQRELMALVMGEPALADDAHPHGHDHDHHYDHDHGGAPANELGWHTHGWGTYHSHRIDLVAENRPGLGVLLVVAIAGGILPDPTALAILLAALSSGKVLLGLVTVVVFSLGFAATLVEDGCRAIDLAGSLADAMGKMAAAGVERATSDTLAG